MTFDETLEAVEQLSVADIENEISNLESRIEKLRRLLSVRRGLKPRAKRGRKLANKNAEGGAQ